jgi:hypothetical protein
MTSQGSAHGRFTRAIAGRNLAAAEIAARELGGLALADALEYLVLLAELRPERAEPAALRWHGRLELEAAALTLSESQLALAAYNAGPTAVDLEGAAPNAETAAYVARVQAADRAYGNCS